VNSDDYAIILLLVVLAVIIFVKFSSEGFVISPANIIDYLRGVNL